MNGVTFFGLAARIDVFDQVEVVSLHDLVTEGDHLGELPAGVHMQEREGYAAGIEGLARRCSSTDESLPIE